MTTFHGWSAKERAKKIDKAEREAVKPSKKSKKQAPKAAPAPRVKIDPKYAVARKAKIEAARRADEAAIAALRKRKKK
jgi:hypothetical protein